MLQLSYFYQNMNIGNQCMLLVASLYQYMLLVMDNM